MSVQPNFKWMRDTLFLNCKLSPGTQWDDVLKYSEYLWAVHVTDNKDSIKKIIEESARGGSLKHWKIKNIQDSDGYGGDGGIRQFFTRYSAEKPEITPYDKVRHKYAILFKLPLDRGNVPMYVTINSYHRQHGPWQGDVIFDFKTEEIRESFKELVIKPKTDEGGTMAYSPDEIQKRLSDLKSKATEIANTFPEDRREDRALFLYENIAIATNYAVFNGIPQIDMIAGVFENKGTFENPQYENITDNYEALKEESEEEEDFEEWMSLEVGAKGYCF